MWLRECFQVHPTLLKSLLSGNRLVHAHGFPEPKRLSFSLVWLNFWLVYHFSYCYYYHRGIFPPPDCSTAFSNVLRHELLYALFQTVSVHSLLSTTGDRTAITAAQVLRLRTAICSSQNERSLACLSLWNLCLMSHLEQEQSGVQYLWLVTSGAESLPYDWELGKVLALSSPLSHPYPEQCFCNMGLESGKPCWLPAPPMVKLYP